MATTRCVEVESKHHPLFELCKRIRLDVFVNEQGVDGAVEMDHIDEFAQHLLVLMKEDGGSDDWEPVATMRIFPYSVPEHPDKMVFKLGRIAVIRSRRGTGIGRLLLEAAEQFAVRQCANPQSGVFLYLHSQSDKLGFYERFGYSVVRSAADLDKANVSPSQDLGEDMKSLEFLEDGILHVRMFKHVTR